MGADAFDGNGGGIGGECLVLDIAGSLAVDGVGKIGAEFLQIDLVDAAADLLVGREQDLDGAMFDLRIVDQETRRIHDFGKPGLVVGAEQRGAVRGDDIIADLIEKRRMIGDPDDLRRVARQHDVAAPIVLDDLRFDVRAGAVRRSVHMRAEANDGNLLVRIGRNGRIDVAMFVEMGVADSHRLKFAGKQAAQVFLFLGRWTGRGRRVGLGIDRRIAQKALGHGMGEPKVRSHSRNHVKQRTTTGRSGHKSSVIPGAA